MSKKLRKLKDLDRNHPFYSEDANREWKRRQKRLEQEEKDLVKENRRRYRESNKGEPNVEGDKE